MIFAALFLLEQFHAKGMGSDDDDPFVLTCQRCSEEIELKFEEIPDFLERELK